MTSSYRVVKWPVYYNEFYFDWITTSYHEGIWAVRSKPHGGVRMVWRLR